jgi:hypothetical protein
MAGRNEMSRITVSKMTIHVNAGLMVRAMMFLIATACDCDGSDDLKVPKREIFDGDFFA